jgi:hypothetical protein
VIGFAMKQTLREAEFAVFGFVKFLNGFGVFSIAINIVNDCED